MTKLCPVCLKKHKENQPKCVLVVDRPSEPKIIDNPGPRTEWKASLREKYGENDDI